MINRAVKIKILGIGIALLCCLSMATSAQALHFEFGQGLTLDVDTTVRYTVATRLQDQSDTLLANPNGDDGNRNFDKNSLVKNRFDLLSEADLSFGKVGPFSSLGVFARAHGWYDNVYNRSNDNDSPWTNNSTSVDYDEFTDDTEKLHGKKVEMMDYFLYAGFDVGERSANIRIGQQALNWGETLFLVGGVMSSQGPIDATGFNQPGVELKELFLPVEQVSIQFDLTDNLNIEAYYQWEWEPYRLDEAGSFFSTSDLVDESGESIILGPGFALPRGSDEDPRNSGQWGVSLHYLAENLASTEFGLYYINYHDQLPQVVINPAGGNYHLKYGEDIHILAASFGTVIGITNVSGEATYRKNVPIRVFGGLPTYEDAEIIHYSLSCLHLYRSNWFSDKLSLTAEIGADQSLDFDSDEMLADKFSWGYSFKLKPTWQSVLPGLDINLPVSLSQGVHGNSPLGASFVEGKNKVGVTVELEYKSRYMMQIGYVCFFGGDSNNSQNDRDYLSMNLKYTF